MASHAEGGSSTVYLHIYDLTLGRVKRYQDTIFGEKIGGLYHTGVSVYGTEYFFEGGIASVPSGFSRFGQPRGPYNRRVAVGRTDLLKAEFEKWVRAREKAKYGFVWYHLLYRNCNHFTSEAVKFLTGNDIPEDILKLPALTQSSAIGRLAAPLIDRLYGGFQWTLVKDQWKYRRRLDAQWRMWLAQKRAPKHGGPAPQAPAAPDQRNNGSSAEGSCKQGGDGGEAAPGAAPAAGQPGSAVQPESSGQPASAGQPGSAGPGQDRPQAKGKGAGKAGGGAAVELYSAPANARSDALANVSEGARERRCRVVGRPPPRVYAFGPGDAAGAAALVARLRTAFDRCPAASRPAHAAGFAGLCEALRRLPADAAAGCLASVASHRGPVAGLLGEPEVACLVYLLSPLVALWKAVASVREIEWRKKKKSKPPPAYRPRVTAQTADCPSSCSCTDSSSEDEGPDGEGGVPVVFAVQRLEAFRGSGKYFAASLKIEPKQLAAELTRSKDHLLAAVDAVSRLCLRPATAKILLQSHVAAADAARLFAEQADRPCDQQLRSLFCGGGGLLATGCSRFELLPAPLQVLVMRCYCNAFAAHPVLARVVTAAMASSKRSIALDGLCNGARAALLHKECAMLRLTAVSLLVNVLCCLNRQLATPPAAAAPRSRSQPAAPKPRGAGRVRGDGGGLRASQPSVRQQRSASAPAAAKATPQKPSAPAPMVPPARAAQPAAGPGKPPAPPKEEDFVSPAPSVGSAVIELGTLETQLASALCHNPPQETVNPCPAEQGTASSTARHDGDSRTEDEEEEEETESEPELDLGRTPPAHLRPETFQNTHLRCLVVRSLGRHMMVEADMSVQQRMLLGLYHGCLLSEAARTDVAGLTMSFAHVKRMPDMETRYVARLVEFMRRSASDPPADMCLTGPLRPREWGDLSSAPKNLKEAANAPY
ncbi:DeSI-like protein [Diplonema papillatum]|nr:DeSI-like protein [Diplonema papillatum]